MFKAKTLLIFLIFLLLFSWFTSSRIWKRIKANNSIHSEKEYNPEEVTIEKLKTKSTEATSFVKKNGYNESICFFIDMTLSSGARTGFLSTIF